ncbi:excalibur calcium-binding domain-containing protein [Kitasatospora cineracea]|uniref:Excalibur calcium-binding domain-containing protein n=1 Tax=Kitasatospora cineracea TaxID=88074 RepID=A0A3N4RJ78_9ACTN|nr:excalibur calcium-binding domain-containing protein [Kitasatospora cineracea]RPE33438.1 excalibur calcium-binding domain-containing protein [Kitasatospora cineracea]
MNPYETPPEPEKRSVGLLWGRIALLVFLPPVALVLVWRSHRLRRTEQVLLTALCVLWTVLLPVLIIAPLAGKNTPAPGESTPAPTSDGSSSTSSASPSSSPTPTPSPTPSADPTPTVVVSPPAVVTPTTETATPEPTTSDTLTEPYYRNCAAAKAAGAAPLHRGEPGYRLELDRDGDGVACEK